MNRLGVIDDILFEYLAYYFLHVFDLSIDELHPRREGIFRRYVAKDVERILHKKFANSEKLEFHLNRESLYDSMPESLFHYHSSFKDVTVQTTEGFKEQMKLLNEEERYARSFFSVYEIEISKLKVASRFLEESSHSYNFGVIQQYLERLIPFDLDDFDKNERIKMLKLLPEVHTIFKEEGYAGIQRILKYLFAVDSKINGHKIHTWAHIEKANDVLGAHYLGWDATIGNKCSLNDWNLDVTLFIGEDQKNYFEDYLIDSKIMKVLELLVPYYYTITIDKKLRDGKFEIGGNKYNQRLSQMTLNPN